MTPEIFQYRREKKCDEGVVLSDNDPKHLIGCGCKSLEKEDYYALLLTSIADIPGEYFGGREGRKQGGRKREAKKEERKYIN
jgi:hypothetical protein